MHSNPNYKIVKSGLVSGENLVQCVARVSFISVLKRHFLPHGLIAVQANQNATHPMHNLFQLSTSVEIMKVTTEVTVITCLWIITALNVSCKNILYLYSDKLTCKQNVDLY